MYGNGVDDYFGSYEKLPDRKNPVQTAKQTSNNHALRGVAVRRFGIVPFRLPLECASDARMYTLAFAL